MYCGSCEKGSFTLNLLIMREYKKFFKKWGVIVFKYKCNYRKYKRAQVVKNAALVGAAVFIASIVYYRVFLENNQTTANNETS